MELGNGIPTGSELKQKRRASPKLMASHKLSSCSEHAGRARKPGDESIEHVEHHGGDDHSHWPQRGNWAAAACRRGQSCWPGMLQTRTRHSSVSSVGMTATRMATRVNPLKFDERNRIRFWIESLSITRSTAPHPKSKRGILPRAPRIWTPRRFERRSFQPDQDRAKYCPIPIKYSSFSNDKLRAVRPLCFHADVADCGVALSLPELLRCKGHFFIQMLGKQINCFSRVCCWQEAIWAKGLIAERVRHHKAGWPRALG